ncbi:hypothetical protein HMPREF3293_01260 [Christensenella minuta]|uniref:Uncharacterized protein n=1 Tax=Christensenella minuta TaxID=626937 RepID=A0A136Q5K7_9FIRM|nr:hypothetical protein HMPREF3293_01260 [Christensenella minuta]
MLSTFFIFFSSVIYVFSYLRAFRRGKPFFSFIPARLRSA